jgi:hypothetical protein
MHHDRASVGVSTLLFLSLLLSLGTAFAKKPPKTYPEEGKVIGSGAGQHTSGGGFLMSNAPSSVTVHTVYTRTYKIETDTKIYELDCGMPPAAVFSSNPEECGGDKKIQIGDVIHFRTDKGWAYIPVVETVTNPDTYAKGSVPGEQKLRILNEELKLEPRPAGSPSAVPPAAVKPPDAKQ